MIDKVGSAMYLSTSPGDSDSPKIVKAPSERAGLYIHPRQAPGEPRPEALKVSIPPDCLGTYPYKHTHERSLLMLCLNIVVIGPELELDLKLI